MKFGPTFADECAAAGLAGLPFSWGEPNPAIEDDDGIFGRERLTSGQNAMLDAVIAAHDPDASAVSVTAPPVLYAIALLAISEGQISGIEVASKFSAALWMDVGLYYVFFTESQPGLYLAKAYHDGVDVRVAEKAGDYIVVTAADANGQPIDPPDISIEIIRTL